MGETDDSSGNENDRAIASQLPSHNALQGHGGTRFGRKKLFDKLKSGHHTPSKHEVVDMKHILNADQVAFHSTEPQKKTLAETKAAATINDPLIEELTYNDLDSIKELPCPMAKKKEVRKNIITSQGKIDSKSVWKKEVKAKWRRFKEDTTEAFMQLQLWRSAIHEIEGRFGSGIRSYFAFIRWIFLLNIYIFVLFFLFVVIPTVIFERRRRSEAAISINLGGNTTINETCAYNPYDPTEVNSLSQYVIWWFTGQGFMEKTLLFYGYYSNSASLYRTKEFYFFYNIPLAYLFVTFFYFFLSLILMVRRATYGIRESLVTDDRFYSYCNQVFSGWDYCIRDYKAAEIKHISIRYDIQSDLEEERIRARQASRTEHEKVILYTKRFFINVLVLFVLTASLFSIFYAAQYALQNASAFRDNFFLDLIITFLTSIVITLANFIAPIFFEYLVVHEDYSPEFTIRITLIRTVVLRLSSIIFLYVVVYLQINCDRYPNIVATKYVEECGYCEGVVCWETFLGQEIYKLTLLDFFLVVGQTLLVEFPRKLLVTYSGSKILRKWVGLQEFSIPSNVLDITYSQTLLWLGAFYAPLLPFMVVIKFYIFFYIKRLTLVYNCCPAQRPYKASKSGTFFFIILLFGFAVAVFPVAVSVGVLVPSKDCGPFRGEPSMFYAVTSSIFTLPRPLQDTFWFLGSTGFAAILIVFLCLALYYYFAVSTAHRRMILLLRHQLSLEGKDKQFLLNRVNKLNAQIQSLQQSRPKRRTLVKKGHSKRHSAPTPSSGNAVYLSEAVKVKAI